MRVDISTGLRTMKLAESPPGTIRLVIVRRLRLDGDALAALFQAHSNFRVLCATTSIKVALTVGRHRRPDVVVFDGGLVSNPGDSFNSLIQQLADIPVLVLDDEVNHGHVTALLNLPCVAYFTRGTPFHELAEGIQHLIQGESAFDSTISDRIEQTPNGRQFRCDPGTVTSPLLTPREIEVWKLIAQGHSVKDCAEFLHLAPSTVDNHKSHLMK